ncbi:hypothetical protein ACVBEG_02905 [Pseudomonas sp. GG8]
MSKLIWILRAALHMRSITGYWSPRNLAFCWETAAVIYDNYEYEGRVDEIGDPAEEINEELSNWGQ